jgi:hypothetical protein
MNKAQLERQARAPAAETLETELAHIAALSLDDVRALWLKMTGQGAPRALSRDLIARMIAYRIQEQRVGKLGREAVVGCNGRALLFRYRRPWSRARRLGIAKTRRRGQSQRAWGRHPAEVGVA